MKITAIVAVMLAGFLVASCQDDDRAHASSGTNRPAVGAVHTSKGRTARIHKAGAHKGCVFLQYGEITTQKVSDDPTDGEWYCAR